MAHDDFTALHRTIGRAAAFAVFFLCVLYAVTTAQDAGRADGEELR